VQRLLVKGNEAVAEAAIRAGCRHYFGYPITPSSEVIEYMARRLPEVGGQMVQSESEVSAVYMLMGGAAAGQRVLSATSSCGFSLMQEGFSFLAAANLPCVVIDVVRLGPALGSLDPSQGDYFQTTRGGGHGDYYTFVLAPASVQEAVDLVGEAFDLADQYRMQAVISMDGVLGQMMEPVVFRDPPKRDLPPKDWATRGKRGGPKHDVVAYSLDPLVCEAMGEAMLVKYDRIRATEQRWESYMTADADLVVVAYGTVGRIAKTAVGLARAKGQKVGLIRPISLWPYPTRAFDAVAASVKGFLTVEMNMGQMVEDVRLAVNGRVPVWHQRRLGGIMPTSEEIAARIDLLIGEVSGA